MKNPLIIDRPDLQAWQQKAVFGALTAVFWAIWVFLWLPLVTLIGWIFFGYQFQFHMIRLEGYEGFLNLLAVYALVILAMNGALIGWAKYNHFRFRGVDRRKGFIAPTAEELAALHQVSSATIAQWQACSVMTVYHDDHGAIVRVVPEPVEDAVANLASGRGNGA